MIAMKPDKIAFTKSSACTDQCCSQLSEDAEQAGTAHRGQPGQPSESKLVLFDVAQLKSYDSFSSGGRQNRSPEESGDKARDGRNTTRVYRLSGLDCADCATKLEKRIVSLPGVDAARVNFSTGKMSVDHSIDSATIIKAVEQAGYGAEVEPAIVHRHHSPQVWWRNARTVATLVSGLVLGCAALGDWLGIDERGITMLYALATVTGAFHAARSGLYGLRALSFDMNFLMTAAIVGAAILGEWSEGATVAFLFSFGNSLQAYTMDKTRRSIQSLMELAPAEALIRRGDVEKHLPVEEILVGEIMIVKPGERIAMDGVVRDGSSTVNQAAITGESIPVEKASGDSVYAGTVNEFGALEIEVTQLAVHSTLAKIFHLIEEAQSQKAPSQQFVDIFAKYYTPLVLALAALVMIVPWLLFGQSFAPWFYKGLVLLVISCPCALVISTPVSIVSAIGNASRNGVLIKGGAYLEEMGRIRSVAFDKTGTLTKGKPEITDIVSVNGYTEDQVLAMAASMELRSEHPLARAIVEQAGQGTLYPVANFQAVAGRGAQAEIDGRVAYIGNWRFFTELGYSLNPYEQKISEFEQQGKTVIFLGSDKNIFGIIALADALRENSRNIVQILYSSGMKHVAMLTGDNERVAHGIANTLGLDAYYSELLPEDKVSAVKRLQADFGAVAMVGDGVNDAPALASASVGIAMGGAGSDTALETADIVLMSDELEKIHYTMQLSRKTVTIIRQNITFSIAVKLIFLLLLSCNMATLWLAVFADMGTSLLVTMNGMRLMRQLREI